MGEEAAQGGVVDHLGAREVPVKQGRCSSLAQWRRPRQEAKGCHAVMPGAWGDPNRCISEILEGGLWRDELDEDTFRALRMQERDPRIAGAGPWTFVNELDAFGAHCL